MPTLAYTDATRIANCFSLCQEAVFSKNLTAAEGAPYS